MTPKNLFLCTLVLLWFSAPSAAGPVPDTGQTESYTTTFGEDSDYTINPPSYTKLGASGNDLPDSATEWYMVRDNVTGLIWEVKQNKDDVPNYGDPHDADNTYTWYDSNPHTNKGNAGTPGDGTDTEDFINALNAQWFGGYNDWRMPTIKEFAEIVVSGHYNPALEKDYFPNGIGDFYWTSTCRTGYVWLISGYWGDVATTTSKQDIQSVRAVRGGSYVDNGQLTDNGDGTITDNGSGLMWQKTSLTNEIDWEDAIEYSKVLSLGAYADWRLPNLKELRSIVDYDFQGILIDTEYFPEAMYSTYWSSTGMGNATTETRKLGIDFTIGFDVSKEISELCYSRFVRGGQNQVPGNLIISSPIQGSTWNAGMTMPIRWDTAGISANVSIAVSSQGGKTGTFYNIVDSTPNDGSYDWTVDGGTSVNYALRITPINDPSKATTQSLFTINNFSRKAIIVAGGGDYEGNTLWDATRMCASYAYSTLNVQGYDKTNLYYLSPETQLDLDNDGVPEVSADATNTNLEQAIRTWAADGDNLVVYLVGHGGAGTFRMGENELLYAADLDADGISEVFAVIRPPSADASDAPVTDLPTVMFTAKGDGRYEGSYSGFTESGTYHVAVFARDSKGVLSLPKQTSVTTAKGSEEGCITVGADLSIALPCVTYNESHYRFTLRYYQNPADPFGFYWKMDGSTLKGVSGVESCLPVEPDLSIALPCISYGGTQYEFTLRFYRNLADPTGFYWKMDSGTFGVK